MAARVILLESRPRHPRLWAALHGRRDRPDPPPGERGMGRETGPSRHVPRGDVTAPCQRVDIPPRGRGLR